jgi:hypothetical protein
MGCGLFHFLSAQNIPKDPGIRELPSLHLRGVAINQLTHFRRRPALTFVTILMLPSLMTLITLIIHRIRAARQAQRDRAPEDIVRSLPWQVWTGSGWEKHEGPVPKPDDDGNENARNASQDLEHTLNAYNEQPSSASRGVPTADSESQARLPWFEQQHECAICLCEFVKGDRVRVLPCNHIFHLDEVDDWLINRKKLVGLTPELPVCVCIFAPCTLCARFLCFGCRRRTRLDCGFVGFPPPRSPCSLPGNGWLTRMCFSVVSGVQGRCHAAFRRPASECWRCSRGQPYSENDADTYGAHTATRWSPAFAGYSDGSCREFVIVAVTLHLASVSL